MCYNCSSGNVPVPNRCSSDPNSCFDGGGDAVHCHGDFEGEGEEERGEEGGEKRGGEGGRKGGREGDGEVEGEREGKKICTNNSFEPVPRSTGSNGQW